MQRDYLAIDYGNALHRVLRKEKIMSKAVGYTRAPRYDRYNVKLRDSSDLSRCLKLESNLALEAGAEQVLIVRDQGLIVVMFQLPKDNCKFYSHSQLSEPNAIGVGEKEEIIIDFNDTYAHSKVVGITGSGKSETLKSIAMALIKAHKQDAVQLVMLDPGRDFLDFAGSSHLAAPIAFEDTEIDSTIEYVYNLLEHRMKNRILDGIRVVMLCDEVEASVKTADKIAKIEAISKRGRKHKINLILGGQEFVKPYHSLAGQLNNVFIGAVKDAQISARLSGQAGMRCEFLGGKGDFLHIKGAESARFQVAQVTEQDFKVLERVEQPPVVLKEEEIKPVNTAFVEEPDKGGRPEKCVEPPMLAFYVKYNDKITIARAKEHLGLSKNMHNKYKEFSTEFLTEWRKL